MSSAIIFGANGQDGFYLNKLLVAKGINVIGISRNGNFLRTNINDFIEVKTLIESEKPDYIFHLAANSTTNHSALFENHQTISTGTLNILEAVKEYSPKSKVFISGSGLQFINKNIPIKEIDLFDARDAYSVSRIQSVYAARYFRNKFGLKVYVGYFFNHDSPRRSDRHISQRIVSTVKRIANGSKEKLLIGDIKTIKEWTFAGDVVEGIWCLINNDAIFEANIGSGIGYSIEEWIELCFNMIGKSWIEFVEIQNDYIAEYKMLVSDSSLLNSIGWIPKTSLAELANMMMLNEYNG
jgi:GDPmannose 4,6-dehydratase